MKQSPSPLDSTSEYKEQHSGVGEWLREFVPRKGARSGDTQTLLAAFLPRRLRLPVSTPVLVTVDAAMNSRVLCHCNWQPEEVRSDRMTLLLVHGLEGSSESQYMLGNADKAWRAGWNVIRMNMRNCGGTEQLSPTLYHSGMSGDVLAVAEHFARQYGLRQMAWVGYSMGGNLVLKAAGECGATAPEWLRAVVGVSPVVDLAPSADALHEPRNRIYEWNFLRNMLGRYRRKAALFPGTFSLANCKRVRSIRQYDEYIVSPNCGFLGADDYYHRASSARTIDRIGVPALILHALDDPFIRMLPETRSKILANPCISLVETERGGHCGFLTTACSSEDGYWAELTLQRFIHLHALPGMST
ncbi:MAG TPA: alpha/beta fold hydrolase [Acidobacteriaceae bacterium]|nr:alpha/beta fold hydrolase [Acidobacteriaceae bacterium]